MKKLLTVLLPILFCLHVKAENNPTDSALQVALTKKIDTLNSNIKSLKDSLNATFKITSAVDSSALDEAIKHPQQALYSQYFFCGKSNPNCKPGKTMSQWFFLVTGLLLLIFVWIVAVWAARTSGLLKDPAYDTNGARLNPKDCTYSYSRVQLFWWTMIILTCCIIMFAFTGVLIPFNGTVVALLGLGAITHGAGRIIDTRQIAKNAKGTRTQDLTSQNPNVKPDLLTDILSDDNGICIHRFQSVVFDVLFGIAFIGYFINTLGKAYPFVTFTEWQFGLLGISSATYIGLKAASENK